MLLKIFSFSNLCTKNNRIYEKNKFWLGQTTANIQFCNLNTNRNTNLSKNIGTVKTFYF